MLKYHHRQWLTNALVGLVIFLVPTNLFLKFGENFSYVRGIQIDYLIPKLYLSDLATGAVIGLALIEIGPKVRTRLAQTRSWLSFFQRSLFKRPPLSATVVIGLIGLFLLRQILSAYPVAAGWYLLKIGEMAALVGALLTLKNQLQPRWLLLSLNTTLIFQSVVGLYQYLVQRSVGGFLFLGEADLSRPWGLATSASGGLLKILPYGTTAHPNILAGTLVIFGLISWRIYRKLPQKTGPLSNFYHYLALGMAGVTLLATHSWSADLMLALGIILIRKKFAVRVLAVIAGAILFTSPILVADLSQLAPEPSLTRRHYLNQAADHMFWAHPWTGVGLNNFVTQVEDFSPSREVVRFTQPVHHVGWLFLSETGLLGVGLLLMVGFHHRAWIKQNRRSLAYLAAWLSPVAALDHYLYTSQTGWLLVVISFFFLKKFLFPPQK